MLVGSLLCTAKLHTKPPDPDNKMVSHTVQNGFTKPRTSPSNVMKFCTNCRCHKHRRLKSFIKSGLEVMSFQLVICPMKHITART